MSAAKQAAAAPAAAPDIESVLAAARPRETTLRLCMAGDLGAEADRLVVELDRLGNWKPSSLADVDPRAALAAELDAIIEQMRAAEVEFRFRALPRQEFSDLIAAHPPKEEGKAFDPDSMQVELVARACISPAMTMEQSAALFDVVNETGRDELFNAAFAAQRAGTRIPTSRAASVNPESSGSR